PHSPLSLHDALPIFRARARDSERSSPSPEAHDGRDRRDGERGVSMDGLDYFVGAILVSIQNMLDGFCAARNVESIRTVEGWRPRSEEHTSELQSRGH